MHHSEQPQARRHLCTQAVPSHKTD
jgi:hypothetical protein